MFTSKPPTCAGRTLALPRKDRDIRYLRPLGNSDIAIFPGLLWLVHGGLVQATGDPLSFRDLVWLSVTTLIPVDGIYSVSATTWSGRSILASEALTGIVAAGLLITLLVRRMVKA